MEKALRHQRNMSSWPQWKRHGFTEDCFKKYNIKDTMPIKISFMHYMNPIRVMLPAVFEEFEVAYVFFLLFSFYYRC